MCIGTDSQWTFSLIVKFAVHLTSLYYLVLYNKEENKLFCLVDAPDKVSVRKYHEKFGTTISV